MAAAESAPLAGAIVERAPPPAHQRSTFAGLQFRRFKGRDKGPSSERHTLSSPSRDGAADSERAIECRSSAAFV